MSDFAFGAAETPLVQWADVVAEQLELEQRTAYASESEAALAAELEDLEASYERWLKWFMPGHFRGELGAHHHEFFRWLWPMRPQQRVRPYVIVWPRGGLKSTSVEGATVALGARRRREYILYVSETQDQADKHVETIGAMLESQAIARYYPGIANRKLGKYGQSRGWRRNRLHTASGVVWDAMGLDSAQRGAKVEEKRPDLVVLDDIDGKHDSLEATAKKLETISETIIPMMAPHGTVVAAQNLLIPTGVFARLVKLEPDDHVGLIPEDLSPADMLFDRVVNGPVPAVEGLEYEARGNRWAITGGTPTWPGMDLAASEAIMNSEGPTAFLVERQHQPRSQAGGIFSHLDFESLLVELDELPVMRETVLACDPAVSSTKKSDSQAISAAGLGEDGIIYLLFGLEKIMPSYQAILRAHLKALEWAAQRLLIETDQGGDTWESVVALVRGELVKSPDYPHVHRLTAWPRYQPVKAGSTSASKIQRGQQIVPYFETGKVRILRGTHKVIIDALRRFGKQKPFDLADAVYWLFYALLDGLTLPSNVQIQQMTKPNAFAIR
jgi:hypothetical protein